jgi:hypothetical protein
MPRLPPVISHVNPDPEVFLSKEAKPGEIIEHIVRAAKRRWVISYHTRNTFIIKFSCKQ